MIDSNLQQLCVSAAVALSAHTFFAVVLVSITMGLIFGLKRGSAALRHRILQSTVMVLLCGSILPLMPAWPVLSSEMGVFQRASSPGT